MDRSKLRAWLEADEWGYRHVVFSIHKGELICALRQFNRNSREWVDMYKGTEPERWIAQNTNPSDFMKALDNEFLRECGIAPIHDEEDKTNRR